VKKTGGLWLFLSIVASIPCHGQYKLYEEGVNFYNQKNYYGAIESFSDFLTKPQRDKKHDVDAYYWRGLASYKLNDYLVASEDFKQALLLGHANTGNINWFLAKSLTEIGQYNEAIYAFSKALDILGKDHQKEVQILTDRSVTYERMGNATAALADLQKAVQIQPENAVLKDRVANLSEVKSRNAQTTPAKEDAKPVENKPAQTESVAQQKTETRPQTEVKKEPDPVKTEPVKTEIALQSAPQKKEDPVVTAPVPTEPTLEDLYGDEKRYALVIGNSAYSKEIGVLKNPVNDATDFAKALQNMNFDVTLITDASYGKIRAEMMKFRDKLNLGERDKTVGLFYYAGHGLQHDNENYLVPVDAEIQYVDDIARFCFPIQKMVLSQMEMSNSRMNIVILDACRNNPFPAIHRGIGESQGLGEMKKARGAFIAYATSPGSVASDGSGRNGLYTQELIKAMSKPGRTIEQVFKEVRANVLRQSGDQQNPWENSNIIGDFYFKIK
jgi:tetratricopeptide (TPR) repeat protein